MKHLQIIIVAILFISVSSCRDFGRKIKGNGNVTTVNRQVSDATRIKVYGSMDVEIMEGETSVKVTADENLQEYIKVENEGGALAIRMQDHINFFSDNDIKVYISTPKIEELTIAGSGNINGKSKFVLTDKMSFTASGSGDIAMELNAPEVSAKISGSGNIDLKGETKEIKVSIAGSGNFNGKDLKSENAEVSIAGSGDATIFADVNLSAKIAGSGSIEYSGNAAVTQKIAGSGTVTKAN